MNSTGAADAADAAVLAAAAAPPLPPPLYPPASCALSPTIAGAYVHGSSIPPIVWGGPMLAGLNTACSIL